MVPPTRLPRAQPPAAVRERRSAERDPLARALAHDMTLDELECEYIQRVLAAEGGNETRAAQRPGLDRKTLYRKLEEYAAARPASDAERAAPEGAAPPVSESPKEMDQAEVCRVEGARSALDHILVCRTAPTADGVVAARRAGPGHNRWTSWLFWRYRWRLRSLREGLGRPVSPSQSDVAMPRTSFTSRGVNMSRLNLAATLSVGSLSLLFTPALAEAHFTLGAPTSWWTQTGDINGAPQKTPPCGNESASYPSTAATGVVNVYQPGQPVTVTVTSTIAHLGWWRVSLHQGTAATQTTTSLPDPPTLLATGAGSCTPAFINNPVWSPTQPVIADKLGLPAGSTRTDINQTGTQSFQVPIPASAQCTMASPCTLQVMMIMTDHTMPGQCNYHHCANMAMAGSATGSGGTTGTTDAGTSGQGGASAGTGGRTGAGGSTTTGAGGSTATGSGGTTGGGSGGAIAGEGGSTGAGQDSGATGTTGSSADGCSCALGGVGGSAPIVMSLLALLGLRRRRRSRR